MRGNAAPEHMDSALKPSPTLIEDGCIPATRWDIVPWQRARMQSHTRGVTSKGCRSQLAGTIWTSKELFQDFPDSTVDKARDTGLIPGPVRSREKEIATHSSILAWKILWPEEPGRLLSIGSHRVGHDWSDWAAATASKIPHAQST